MKSNKKKAFTLTELLVVVIVIGVLSAAVLPKFSKVIETRKTTEAEELMASVRTEQEKRCALDKQYLTQMSEMTDIVKNNDTKNFTITLAERGIDAASKGKYNYTLKMPSYADGRICCDGTGCNKLNKNYPTCDELKGKPDYQESPADCAGIITEPEEPSGPCDIDPYSCECDPNQAKCCAEDEVWQDGKCVSVSAKACSSSYCYPSSSWDKWKYHDAGWYKDRTWVNDETECCDPNAICPATCPDGQKRIRDYYNPSYGTEEDCCKTLCPETCPDGQVRTSNSYEENGACCGYSCREFCGGSGYDCPNLNNKLNEEANKNGTNRRYWWRAWWKREPWLYYGDPSECYHCDEQLKKSAKPNGWLDYKDASGNVINPGVDMTTCSVAEGCPAGYIADKYNKYKCYAINKFIPEEHTYKGAVVYGDMHIGAANGAFAWFDGGSAMRKGKCWVWSGGKPLGTNTITLPSAKCSAFGGPAAFCNEQCANSVTCEASCYADDTQDTSETLRTKEHSIYVETSKGISEKVPDSCCNHTTTQGTLASSLVNGCTQPKTKQTVSVHFFKCVVAK